MNCPSKDLLYNAVYKVWGLQAVYSLAICLGGVYYLEDRDPAAQHVSEALWFHYCFVINSKAIQTAGLPEGKGSNKQTASILRTGNTVLYGLFPLFQK